MKKMKSFFMFALLPLMLFTYVGTVGAMNKVNNWYNYAFEVLSDVEHPMVSVTRSGDNATLLVDYSSDDVETDSDLLYVYTDVAPTSATYLTPSDEYELASVAPGKVYEINLARLYMQDIYSPEFEVTSGDNRPLQLPQPLEITIRLEGEGIEEEIETRMTYVFDEGYVEGKAAAYTKAVEARDNYVKNKNYEVKTKLNGLFMLVFGSLVVGILLAGLYYWTNHFYSFKMLKLSPKKSKPAQKKTSTKSKKTTSKKKK